MKETIFSLIITLNLVSIYFLSDTLISYWKYLLPKKKYSYLILNLFLILFSLFLILEIKNIF
jgi:hypothetical protein